MMANMMEGNMRSMMNGLMKVTKHNNDCTYKEVQDFVSARDLSFVPLFCGRERYIFRRLSPSFPFCPSRVFALARGSVWIYNRTNTWFSI